MRPRIVGGGGGGDGDDDSSSSGGSSPGHAREQAEQESTSESSSGSDEWGRTNPHNISAGYSDDDSDSSSTDTDSSVWAATRAAAMTWSRAASRSFACSWAARSGLCDRTL